MASSKLAVPIDQWSNLPSEIWGDIISRIDVLDVMSFSLTCKSLDSVCKQLTTTIKQGTPILLTSQPDEDGWGTEDDLETGKFGLHDVSKYLSFCCVRKGLQCRIWLGGKGEWLVTTNTCKDIELLNPITGISFRLPSFGIELGAMDPGSFTEMATVFPPYVRFVRRVVLSRTPSHADGYEAITLFSDGLIAYTTHGQSVWRMLKNPSDHDDNVHNYYPEIYFDAIVYHGWVFAVDEDGDIFAWNLSDPGLRPVQMPTPEIGASEAQSSPNKERHEHVFYLAISPADQLILACLTGHGHGLTANSYRELWNEHDQFLHLDSISLFEFDLESLTWGRITSIGEDQSLFIGLNYPFFVNSTQQKVHLKGNSVYVADVSDHDVGICSLSNDGIVSISNLNFPVDEKAHVLIGRTKRTPMWFRPAVHT